MKDRIPRYPGRVKLTPVPGEPDTYDMVRADEPTEAGTPLNKNTFLKDTTAGLYGLSASSVPDNIFQKLKDSVQLITTVVPDKAKGKDFVAKDVVSANYGTNNTYYHKFAGGNGVVVCIVIEQNRYFITKDNGNTVTSNTISDISKLYGVAYSNGVFVLSGDKGKMMVTSDFINWTTIQLPDTEYPYLIEAVDGVFIALYQSPSKPKFFISADGGKNWVEHSYTANIPSYNFYDSAVLNGKAIFTQDSLCALLIDKNGNVESRSNLPSSGISILGVVDGYLILNRYNYGTVHISSDLTNWTSVTTAGTYKGGCFSDETYLYVTCSSSSSASDSTSMFITRIKKSDFSSSAHNFTDLFNIYGGTPNKFYGEFFQTDDVIFASYSIHNSISGMWISKDTTKPVYSLESVLQEDVTEKAAEALLPTIQPVIQEGKVKIIVGTASISGTGRVGYQPFPNKYYGITAITKGTTHNYMTTIFLGNQSNGSATFITYGEGGSANREIFWIAFGE